MPANKNFEARLKILDRLICGKVSYSKSELLDKLNDDLDVPISKRQLDYDIDEMKNRASVDEVEMLYDRAAKRYRYNKEGYSITGLPINQKDIQVLTLSLAILQQVEGLHHSKELERIINGLSERLAIQTENLQDIISFDQVPDLKGLEHLHGLLNKIIERQVIEIHYQPYGGEEEAHIVHPYFLKEYNRRWFLFGWDEEAQQIFNFPLDRINAFEDAYIRYKDNHIEPGDYLKDVVGVTRLDKPVECVRFKVDKPRAFYVHTKPIHPSQRLLEESDEYMLFQVEVIPNKELQSVFLSFGEDLEVV